MEDPGDLLDTLRDDDVISPTNTTFLVKMLKNKNVRMKTLADKVKKFTDLYNKKLGHTTKATTNDTSSMVGSKRKRSPDNLFGQSAQQKKKSTGRKGIVSREPGPRDTQGDSAVTAHITRAHTSVLSSKQSDTRIKRTRSADATNVSESKRKQDTDKEIPAFTKILKEISDDLCSYEVEEMKSLLIGKQLSRKDEHKIKTGMNLFLYLQST
ncbi:uncharacterized protein LOC102809663, partial [Saccoglossus kowalevskii]|uniref:Uncharacterized protein LOC102809663 n=1 Tax=Saccoglossus kowalevskii TaxID=10224 RepID=A0ABM0LVQ5_SACKO